MRKRSIFNIFVGFLFKRKCFIFLLILSLIIWLFILTKIKEKSFNNINFSPYDSILDTCMLSSSPCIPDIDQSLNRYFNKMKKDYSMLLTYHPIIDCEYGRYLLLNDSISSHVYHGTGSQLMWYLGVLNVAYVLNLTLIHLEWTSEHTEDENNSDREKYWKFYDWEIPYSAYKSCPKNSSIKKNIFKYNLTPNQTFDTYHQGKKTFKIMNHFKTLFNHFINNLKNKNTGFTFYSSQTVTITSSLMEIGIVFEIRWWLQHRKLYNQQNGEVWSGQNILSNDFKLNSSFIDLNKILLIGIHIRQGDVVKRNKQGQIISSDLYRYISNSAYLPLLIFIINSLPIEIKNNYLITIYSEGKINDFIDIINYFKNNLSESDCHLSFYLNGRTSSTFNRLLRDDILISAYSTFSMAAGIFNSRQLKIGPYHNRNRVHGMRNHLSLDLNINHTKFIITQEKQILIKQRIEYVWKQKQKQLNTHIPLWIDNYSQDYPEEFMLI